MFKAHESSRGKDRSSGSEQTSWILTVAFFAPPLEGRTSLARAARASQTRSDEASQWFGPTTLVSLELLKPHSQTTHQKAPPQLRHSLADKNFTALHGMAPLKLTCSLRMVAPESRRWWMSQTYLTGGHKKDVTAVTALSPNRRHVQTMVADSAVLTIFAVSQPVSLKIQTD